jgi:hypothetical protein
VISKADLLEKDDLEGLRATGSIPASAISPDGLEGLSEAILERFQLADPFQNGLW